MTDAILKQRWEAADKRYYALPPNSQTSAMNYFVGGVEYLATTEYRTLTRDELVEAYERAVTRAEAANEPAKTAA